MPVKRLFTLPLEKDCFHTSVCNSLINVDGPGWWSGWSGRFGNIHLQNSIVICSLNPVLLGSRGKRERTVKAATAPLLHKPVAVRLFVLVVPLSLDADTAVMGLYFNIILVHTRHVCMQHQLVPRVTQIHAWDAATVLEPTSMTVWPLRQASTPRCQLVPGATLLWHRILPLSLLMMLGFNGIHGAIRKPCGGAPPEAGAERALLHHCVKTAERVAQFAVKCLEWGRRTVGVIHILETDQQAFSGRAARLN